jgi:diaminopimelate epimerase
MRVNFTKMHGAGNDFVVFDAPDGTPWLDAATVRRLAHRQTGIGFDQVLILESPRRASTAVFYRIFNADGIEVEQCGNGARCVAALLARRGRAAAGTLTLDSPAGLIRARVEEPATGPSPRVSVDMGIPSFEPASLPFEAAAPCDPYNLEVAGQSLQIGAVAIGNPHAVLTVASVDAAPVNQLGPALETHPRFPKRVNVGFMQIVDPSSIRLRVYERGAGETLACGTGACAAVAVGRFRAQLGAQVDVRVRGGELRVNWEGPGEHIWLTGPAEVSFEGHVEV